MDKKNLNIWIGIGVVLVVVVFLSVSGEKNYDEFANCLTESGVKMFGAYWCPHCATQKEFFGDSFEYVNYIECSLPEKAGQTQNCIDEDIQGYPTWEFADETRLSRVQSLQQLSEKTGCVLS